VDLSIIIVNWNSSELLGNCLSSLEQWATGITYEAIVVDNSSTAQEVLSLKKIERAFPWARFIYSAENAGFSRANNLAAKMAQGEYLLLLNPDTCLIAAGLGNLLTSFEHGDVGLVQCRLLNPDQTLQKSLFGFPSLGQVFVTALLLHKFLPGKWTRRYYFSEQDHESPQSPDWVLGAFMLLPKAVMQRVGGFDESIFMYGEDLDICYRIRQLGLRVLYRPDFSIVHYGDQSGSQVWSSPKKVSMTYRALLYFQRKHYGLLPQLGARVIYAAGALLRLAGYALGSLRPGKLRQGLGGVKVQWWAFLTQLNLK